jgi:lipoic acid synthetase/lipoate-protein ligase A
MAHMQYAITPAPEKLQKNGIQSVRQRITLLKDYTRLSLEEVKDLFRSLLCDGERMLTADEVVGIKQLEQTYLDKQFINLLQQ